MTWHLFRVVQRKVLGGAAALITVGALSAVHEPRSSDETCVPGAATLCLQDGRYEVRADWWTADGESGAATVVPKSTRDSGLFRFFDAENWEMLIKVLDGCAINGHYWVYSAAATDLGLDITVTDTATGAIWDYAKAPGPPAPAITESKAFPDSRGVLPLPELVSPGSIAVEYGVWESNVSYDGFTWSFAADFDGDGDDDVMLPGGRHFEAVAAESGLILLNNGDYTFEVAPGDRPRGVHPREVVMADFDGDGTVDIVPQLYGVGSNVMAWLNDGTGHYAVLKNTEFNDIDATLPFAHGVAVRARGGFKYVEFLDDGTHLEANAGVVVSGAVVLPPD